MGKKTLALILLGIGIVLTLVGLVMGFIGKGSESTWYKYVMWGAGGVGILLVIVGTIFVVMIKEEKTEDKDKTDKPKVGGDNNNKKSL
jgi:cytochrome c biogenesis protein CcdA